MTETHPRLLMTQFNQPQKTIQYAISNNYVAYTKISVGLYGRSRRGRLGHLKLGWQSLFHVYASPNWVSHMVDNLVSS